MFLREYIVWGQKIRGITFQTKFVKVTRLEAIVSMTAVAIYCVPKHMCPRLRSTITSELSVYNFLA